MACAAALVAGLSSCSQDRDPVYHAPTKFVLNEPVMQDQHIALEEDNQDATIELVASQPDYGFSAIVNYSALVSLTPDFAKSVEIKPSGTNGLTPSFRIPQFDLSIAICNLMGLTPADRETATFDYIPVYVKAVAEMDGIEDSRIVSNAVKFNYIKPYFAVAEPKCIYLVGNVSAWSVDAANAPTIYENWRLWDEVSPEGKNTGIYKGTFDFGETTDGGAYTLRFYSALGNWEENSIGSQKDDNPIEFPDFTGSNTFGGAAVEGKGSWKFPNLVPGRYAVTVDLSTKGNWTITIEPGE